MAKWVRDVSVVKTEKSPRREQRLTKYTSITEKRGRRGAVLKNLQRNEELEQWVRLLCSEERLEKTSGYSALDLKI